jgi:hypothetical protein
VKILFNDIIYTSENVEIILEEDQVYIKVLQKKYDLTAFQEILKSFPRIKITQFIALKAAITNAIEQLVNIGEYKPIIELSSSNDQLKAYATINLTPEQFVVYDKKELLELIVIACRDQGIIFGIDLQEVMSSMIPLDKFTIAKGMLPLPGDDAIIKLYEIDELKPQVFDDGKVNHYELNLINKVERGDWVGERIEPTLGIPGKSVFGNAVPALPGKQHKLVYDKKTIDEDLNEDETKTILTAKRVGAVVYENGILAICNYLEIDGKVSFETGNIDFDGHVEVKNSVEDNFSVKANNNIQIMGKIGLGGIDTIESREGSIYIRGGIAGKNKAKIICDGDLYTKFAADCTIECNGSVNIGYYAMNTNIKAKEVILESLNSKIIGGNIEATVRVVSGEIGSRADVPTHITVLGFNRVAYKEEYDGINTQIDTVKEQIVYLNQKLSIYSPNNLDAKQRHILSELEEAYDSLNKKLKTLYEKKKKYISYLHCKGDGEVKINKTVYTNVTIEIAKHLHVVSKVVSVPQSFYVINNQFKTT